MSSFLVTGGAGFIGSHIVERLLDEGHSVRVLDNFCSGKMENINHLIGKLDLVRGDLCDFDLVRKSVDGVDFVLHHAALHSVHESVEDPGPSCEVNVKGTLNVLMAARTARVKRVVFASSCSVYGMLPELPKRETTEVFPVSPYAVTKLVGEHYCRMYTELYGLETVCLRYFNVFGPRQDPHSQYSAVIPRFATAVMAGERPTIYGDGLQSRDFTYVANNVDANIRACFAPSHVSGKIINIASGQRYSLLDILTAIGNAVGVVVKPIFEEARSGDIRHMEGDSSRAKELLGFDLSVDFDTGLRRMIEWMNSKREAK